MNADDRLSEDRHDYRVSGISSRELHIVSELVQPDALQHQLTSVSIFSLVALKRNSKQTNSNGDRYAKKGRRQNPPGDAQESVMALNFVCHKCVYKRRPDGPVANKRFPLQRHLRQTAL